MDQVKWQRGSFHKFFAQMKIRVGGQNAVEISRGDEFEYDGSILKYAGMEIASPQLRGAVSSGWASLTEDSDGVVESIRPNRNIATAKTVNRDLNRVQRNGAQAIETSTLDEDEVLRVTDRAGERATSPRVITAGDNRRGSRIEVSASQENEGAVNIGRIRTSTKASMDVSRGDSDRVIRELENISQVKADLYNKTQTKEGVTIKSNIGKIDRVEMAQEDEGTVIGSVRLSGKRSVEGITIEDTSNIREAKAARVANSIASPIAFSFDPDVNPRVRIAKAIFPSFPENWVFEGKLADRLLAVKQYGASPQFLEALYAAEGDQMRKVLIKEYPEQFSTP